MLQLPSAENAVAERAFSASIVKRWPLVEISQPVVFSENIGTKGAVKRTVLSGPLKTMILTNNHRTSTLLLLHRS
jgi:hypothetical protein